MRHGVRRVLVILPLAAATVWAVTAIAQSVPSAAAQKQEIQQKVIQAKPQIKVDAPLDTKLAEPFVLERATLVDAIEALKNVIASTGARISFAAKYPDEANRRVTVYIAQGKTIRDVIEIIADMYGCSWRVRDGIVTLEPTPGPISALRPRMQLQEQALDQYRQQLEKVRGLLVEPPEGRPMIRGIRGPEQTAKALREAADALRKAADRDRPNQQTWQKIADMLREQAERLDKLADEMGERGGFLFMAPEGEALQRLRDLDLDKLHEEFGLDELGKEFRLRIPEDGMMFEFGEDGWERFPPEKIEEMQKWLEEHGYHGPMTFRWRDMLKEMPDLEKLPELIDPDKIMKLREFGGQRIAVGGNISDLMDSITDKQWKLHEKQGFLRLEDLTEEQREMLGGVAAREHGKFTISLQINDRKLTIKSD
jgi:hypothetical protein